MAASVCLIGFGGEAALFCFDDASDLFSITQEIQYEYERNPFQVKEFMVCCTTKYYEDSIIDEVSELLEEIGI
ncbi:hypothetical protein [Klebsiella phage 05F01]|nr:hypothetical protein [Klebsiella phage 05F01]